MGKANDGQLLRVVEIMRAAALAGQEAPGNAVIAERLGVSSTGTASSAVKRAEEAGLILVHSGQACRVVAAPDGAWRTAGEVAQPHVARGQPSVRVRRRARRGAAALAEARLNSMRHQKGAASAPVLAGPRGSSPLPGAFPIPPQGGDPTAAEPQRTVSGRDSVRGVSSLIGPTTGADTSPPAVPLLSRPAVFSGLRTCRWPLWADDAKPDHTFCGAAVQRGAYCAARGAIAYTMRAVEAGPVPPMGRTGGWRAA